MKFVVSLLALASLASARSIILDTNTYGIPNEEHPGFSINLQELRLVQVDPSEPPVWWTELQKARSPPKPLSALPTFAYHELCSLS